jgi:hypothetical protein
MTRKGQGAGVRHYREPRLRKVTANYTDREYDVLRALAVDLGGISVPDLLRLASRLYVVAHGRGEPATDEEREELSRVAELLARGALAEVPQ